MLKIGDYSGFILASDSLPLYLSHSCVMTHTAYSKQKAVSIFSLIACGCWDGGWASERWDKAMKLPSRQRFFFSPVWAHLTKKSRYRHDDGWKDADIQEDAQRERRDTEGNDGGKRAEIEPPFVWCYTWNISRLPLSWSHLTYLWPQQIWRLAAEHQRYVNQMTCLLNYPMK